MGVGRELGTQLRRWLAADPGSLRQSRAISNRLIDALGAEEGLRGPIRDLASQPLLLQALHSTGAAQRSALSSLSEQLARTYAPAVLAELCDLLNAATGVAMAVGTGAAEAVGDNTPSGASAPQEPRAAVEAEAQDSPWRSLERFGPGLALAACGALVLAWAGTELDRALFEGWGWSGGVVLVLTLGLLQALAIGPCKPLRRLWSLDQEQTVDPRQAWRWLSAVWIHSNGLEAGLNLLLLLIVLGASPLQLGDVLLRYCLTGLACIGLAALCAQHWRVARLWSGSAGALSALIALAAGLSLLHWRMLSFPFAGLSIPAWVLLLVYGALQLGWQLPRQSATEQSRPLQRLLSSSWGWGLLLGLGWALVSRLKELL